jgi:ribonuclease HI
MQVHKAAEAHINTHLQAIMLLTSTMSTTQAATQPASAAQGMQTLTQQESVNHSYHIAVPSLLQGCRCYVDASTAPDQPNMQPRKAGLGVFILNLQEQPAQVLYITAAIYDCSSVIMAEAAGLALASAITANLNLTGVNFLSDSEQLVRFLNQQEHSNPPDWRIKPLTQIFINNATATASKVYKVHRTLNTTADSLARQALQASMQANHMIQLSCTNENHVPQCHWLQALQHVGLNDVTISAARRC